MNIAIFADVHGKILLCFKLCARWEKETGRKIDLILQAGDMGIFPDKSRLDKATLRYARKDPGELGFLNDFLQFNPKTESILYTTECNLVFVRGNHEDHEWLDTREQSADSPIVSVDVYERLYCLKTGIPYLFRSRKEVVTILGIGRIGPPVEAVNVHKAQYIQPHEMEKLHDLGSLSVDILLTHDSAKDFVTFGFGMEEIRWILDTYKPCYHFFGHVGGPPYKRMDSNGVTTTCKLSDLKWENEKQGKVLKPGSMGLLYWKNRDEHAFDIVNEPWMKEYSASTWKYL
ncbi:MAG: metallophosphoesterase [bacterium]